MEELENGETKLSTENGVPLEGAIAIYKCDDGYKLIGSFTRNCLKDGSWSGKQPQCKGTKFISKLMLFCCIFISFTPLTWNLGQFQTIINQ